MRRQALGSVSGGDLIGFCCIRCHQDYATHIAFQKEISGLDPTADYCGCKVYMPGMRGSPKGKGSSAKALEG
jgi:hypothetical protein